MVEKKKHKKKIVLIIALALVSYILTSLFVPPFFTAKQGEKETIQLASGNLERASLIDDNNAALLWRLRMIQEAQEEIILTTFELRADTSGKAIMGALMEAADRGVTVRVLIDGIDGYLRLHDSEEFAVFCSYENIQVKYYNPFRVTRLWKANYRLHDKYVIIDDTAYILGGRNTHDVYLGEFSDYRQSDREVVVYEADKNEDNSLQQLKEYFETTWALDDCKLLAKYLSSKKTEDTVRIMKEHLKGVYKHYEGQLGKIDWNSETYQTYGVTLLTADPKAGNKTPDIWKQMCGLMENAQTNVLIQTPLINCDKMMVEDLRKICEKTDNVEILTNATQNWVNPFAAGFSYRKKNIIDAGVSVSEYYGKSAFHTKTILIDSNISIIGSYNLDPRSTYIDTEIMLVIDSTRINSILRRKMRQIENQSVTEKSDGTIICGKDCDYKKPDMSRRLMDIFLGIILYPFEYLL